MNLKQLRTFWGLARTKLQRGDQSIESIEPWEKAQAYEWQHSVSFMQEDFFKGVFKEVMDFCDAKNSKELTSELFMKDFFNNESSRWLEFADWIEGKVCLELGPNVAGTLCTWWWSGKRIVIEPLIERIKDYQKDNFNHTIYTDDIVCHALPAEVLIPDLVGAVDGVVVCRNCIDHSPEWIFILNNIATYTAHGAFLLFWSDLFHNERESGHYNLTRDVEGFKRLLSNLGFDFLHEFSYEDRNTLNFGCLARKR